MKISTQLNVNNIEETFEIQIISIAMEEKLRPDSNNDLQNVSDLDINDLPNDLEFNEYPETPSISDEEQQRPTSPTASEKAFEQYSRQLSVSQPPQNIEQAHQIQQAVKRSMIQMGNWLLKEQLENFRVEIIIEQERARNSKIESELHKNRGECSPKLNKWSARGIFDGSMNSRKSSLYSGYRFVHKPSLQESIFPKMRSVNSFKTVFGDKIYENQSSTTMQKSVLSYSVPKADRFASTNYKMEGSTYYTGSCFEPKSKGTSFGIGQRKPYPLWMEKNMKENPAPNTYISSPIYEGKKGPSFGISYRHYEKTRICGTQPLKKTRSNTLFKISKSSNLNFKKPTIVQSGAVNYHYCRQQSKLL